MKSVPTMLSLVIALLASSCSLAGETGEDDTSGAPSPSNAESTSVVAQTVTPTVAPSTTEEVLEPSDPVSEPIETPTVTATAEDVDELGLGRGEYPDEQLIAEVGFEGVCGYVSEAFCTDSNGNLWPDVVEEALGGDPTVDECAVADCIGTDLEEFYLSLQDNTLFILDASGSMGGDAGGGQTKMAAAKSALVEYAQVTPEFADLGLMVYGHRGDNSDAGKAESCAGIETLAPVGAFTPELAESVVGGFEATGWTPIAGALDAAGPVLQQAVADDAGEGVEGATNRVILISDGIETCDGDPVAAAQALVDLGVEVVVDVIGFDIGEADRAALQAVADTTGGTYSDASDGRSLRDLLAQYNRQWQDAIEPITCQRRAIANYSTCNRGLSSEGTRYFRELAREAREDGDRPRGTFLEALLTPLREEFTERWEARRVELNERSDEFVEAVEDAQQRAQSISDEISQKASMTSDFNPPIWAKSSFDCPFAKELRV